MQCHMRVARPVTDLDVTQKMYCSGLDLTVLGQFRDHEGFDGVMLGSPSMSYHFEFTRHLSHQVQPSSTTEDLIVLYEPDEVKWLDMCQKLEVAGFVRVASCNPFWDVRGKTFQDADGYRVVIQNAAWVNAE